MTARRRSVNWTFVNNLRGRCECLRCGAVAPIPGGWVSLSDLRTVIRDFQRGHTTCTPDLSAARAAYERARPNATTAWDDLSERTQRAYAVKARIPPRETP